MGRWRVRYVADGRIIETVIEADNWAQALDVAFATIGDPFGLLLGMQVILH